MKEYTQTEKFVGKIKADYLDARHHLSVVIAQNDLDPDHPEVMPLKAALRRMSINREFAMRYLREEPWEEVELDLRVLLSDSHAMLRLIKSGIRTLIAENGLPALDTTQVPYMTYTDSGFRKVIPPIIIEAHGEWCAELRADGFREPPDFTQNLRAA